MKRHRTGKANESLIYTHDAKNTKNASRSFAKKEERATRFVLATISLLIIVLAIGTIYNSITREVPPSMSVELVTVFGSDLNQGIIVRNEYVYTNPFGQIDFAVENNTRIRQDEVVATISNFSITPLVQENQQLANQILDLQSLRAPISMHTNYVNTINNQIREVTNNNLHRIGDLSFARYFADQINAQVDIRNNLLLSENVGSLEPYVSQSIRNINIISDNQREVRAQQGGIVSFALDGFEHITPENMHNLTPRFLYFSPTAHTETGDFRIVTSNTWYVVAFLDNIRSAPLTPNMNVTLFVEDGESFREIRANVHILDHRGQYTLAVFSLTDFMLDYIDERSISFKLEDTRTTGLRIAENAIANRTLLLVPTQFIYEGEDNYYVTTIRGEGDELVYTRLAINPLTIRGHQTTDGYVYILQDFGNIQLGTTLYLNGRSHVLTQVIADTGVFRVNNGVATFTSINTNGMMEYEADGYLYFILNAELNRGGIMVHDRIVSDTQNYLVHEGQIVH
ncbi:MAG: hypothetical protein FWG63_07005 [Defluviitaleaceae bacterium]|nr:hypothetical protein [Defluviitaleaceae bacterium]